MPHQILAINPGSTSTKLAVYEDTTELFAQNLSHSLAELAQFPTVIDQHDYRLQKIVECIEKQGLRPGSFSAIVGRGGLLKPMESGTYLINAKMIDDLTHSRYGAHASNLGAILADQVAGLAGCHGYIVDPVVVDELDPIARITGRPEIKKRSIFHALNQKAVARRFARSIGKRYEDLNLIVAHLGGGITVGCHKHGRVVEVNNCLDGEGPFSPERSGTVQAGSFAREIITKGLTQEAVGKMLAGQGGLVAHLGTNDVREVERRIDAGDQKAQDVYNAMIYGIARYIAAATIPLYGQVDHILITGGIAHSQRVISQLTAYISHLGPIGVYPGENEMQALAEGAYRVLSGEEAAKEYK